MTCLNQNENTQDEERDQSLLLMAHGALPLWSRLTMQLHLRRCAVCRERVAQLAQTSLVLAAEVRGPLLPVWSPAQAMARARPRPVLWGIVAAGLLLTAILSVALLLVIPHTANTPFHPAASYTHCR
jgi:hypothetical protein